MAIGLLVLSVLLASFAVVFGVLRAQAESRWVSVAGTVVAIEQGKHGPDPVWEYSPDGRKVRTVLPHLSDPDLAVGARLPLVADRKDPRLAIVDTFARRFVVSYVLPGLAGLLALAVGATGIGLLGVGSRAAAGPGYRRRGTATTCQRS